MSYQPLLGNKENNSPISLENNSRISLGNINLLFPNSETTASVPKPPVLVRSGPTPLNRLLGGINRRLLSAAQYGELPLATDVLARGADVNTFATNGYSALMIACQYKRVEIVKLLIQHGADVNATERFLLPALTLDIGYTPLMIATDRSYLDIATLLIQNGADVNARTRNGTTALMIASKGGSFAIVKLLCQNNADLTIVNKLNKTAIHYAGNMEIYNFLAEGSCNLLPLGPLPPPPTERFLTVFGEDFGWPERGGRYHRKRTRSSRKTRNKRSKRNTRK